MQVIVYTDPSTGNVVALTPPGGMTAEDAQASMVPAKVKSWIVDNSTLPESDIRSWALADGVVSVNPNWTPPPPPTPAQKLAEAGLTVADLKTLLGLT